MHKSLFECCVLWHLRISRTEERPGRIDFVAFIELRLQVWQPNHHSKVLPNIPFGKLQRFPHEGWCADLRPRHFAPQRFLTLEAIEVLSESTAVGF